MKKCLMLLPALLGAQVAVGAPTNNGTLKGYFATQEVAKVHPEQFIRLGDKSNKDVTDLMHLINQAQPIKDVWENIKWKRNMAHVAVEQNKTVAQAALIKAAAVEREYIQQKTDLRTKKVHALLASGVCYAGVRWGLPYIKSEMLKKIDANHLAIGAGIFGGLMMYWRAKGSDACVKAAGNKMSTAQENLNLIADRDKNDAIQTDFFSGALEKPDYADNPALCGGKVYKEDLQALLDKFDIVCNGRAYSVKQTIPTITEQNDKLMIVASKDPVCEGDIDLLPDEEIHYDHYFTACNGRLLPLPKNKRELKTEQMREAYKAKAEDIVLEELCDKVVAWAKKGASALGTECLNAPLYHVVNAPSILKGLQWYDADGNLHQKGRVDYSDTGWFGSCDSFDFREISMGPIKVVYSRANDGDGQHSEITRDDYLRNPKEFNYMKIEQPDPKGASSSSGPAPTKTTYYRQAMHVPVITEL